MILVPQEKGDNDVVKAVFLLRGHKASAWTPPGEAMEFGAVHHLEGSARENSPLSWSEISIPVAFLNALSSHEQRQVLILRHRCSSITKRNDSIVMNLLFCKLSIFVSLEYSSWNVVLMPTSCTHSRFSVIVHHCQELFIFIHEGSNMPL